MKIVRLSAENIKKLRAVEITPNGDIVTISGKNGQGKTSVLDSIWWALTGTQHIQGEPIRRGETKARIRLDLGELVVERKFTPKGSALSVESADGARFPSPQTMLDKLIGELSFDPLAFARMDPKKQFDELRRVSKLDVDIDHMKGLNRAEFERRTDVNRDAKAKRARAEGYEVPPKPAGEAVDERALVDELQQAGETNAEIERRRAARTKCAEDAQRLQLSGKQLRERAALLRKQADELDSDAASDDEAAAILAKKLADAPPLAAPVDASALRTRIDKARTLNAQIASHHTAVLLRATLAQEAKALEDRSRELTASIEAREQAMRDAIASAAMPVEGLGFGDGHVTYNGIPFDQASSAEQLRVSMSIAMASNPKLRVIRITDGSLLDEDSLAAIGAMANAADFQVWVECVDSSGTVGVVIEDGAVASTPESRADPDDMTFAEARERNLAAIRTLAADDAAPPA